MGSARGQVFLGSSSIQFLSQLSPVTLSQGPGLLGQEQHPIPESLVTADGEKKASE